MLTNELIYSGSVKDIYKSDSDIVFKFSDRYSIFDWGEMPDHILNKGQSLATMGSLFFKYLNQHNIPNHYIGHDQDTLKVKKIHVPYDNPVSYYTPTSHSCLIPLEVIFRFKIFNTASFKEKIDRVEFSDLDFTNYEFAHPLVEFSTKLEASDRYIDYKEAKEISSLSEDELSNLISLAQRVAILLKDLFSQNQLDLIDGKLEFAFDENRNIFLVDTIGLDELRIERHGVLLSKEFLRDFYKSTLWFGNLQKFKTDFQTNWKDEMTKHHLTPDHLPREVLEQVQNLYRAFTNTLSKLVESKKTSDDYQIEHYFQQYYKGRQ